MNWHLKSAYVVCAPAYHGLDHFFVALTGIRRVERNWDQRFESAFLQRRVRNELRIAFRELRPLGQ
jgi:hypothetical protein